MKTAPKGFVEPTEMDALCEKIRVLLLDRKNVALENDWRFLQQCVAITMPGTVFKRQFTNCERDCINSIYGSYEVWKRRKKCPQK